MSTSKIISLVLVAALACFAAGRWSAPEKVKIETKTVEVEKKVVVHDAEKDKHKTTTKVVTRSPDGTETSTTTTTEDDKATSHTNRADTTGRSSETSKEVTSATSKVTLMTLVGFNVKNLGQAPVLGGSISKPVLGPITLGGFYFMDGRVGLSIGLTF